MIKRLPVIRDALTWFSTVCCPRPVGIKPLHKVPRTSPPLVVTDNQTQNFLQDEDGMVFDDEQDAGKIYDDLKQP